MEFPVGAKLLDAMVLSIVSRKETYGYEITHELQKIIDVSESTLYPVLRRLQKDVCLEAFDLEYKGRNRRYYRITVEGKNKLEKYCKEWNVFKEKIDKIIQREFFTSPTVQEKTTGVNPEEFLKQQMQAQAAARIAG